MYVCMYVYVCVCVSTTRQVSSSADQDADWGPTVDGVVLPLNPRDMLRQGRLNPGVSVLWGETTWHDTHPVG